MARQAAKPVKATIIARLRKQYQAGTLNLRQLAALQGVSITTVWRKLKRQGISRGSSRGRPPNSKKRSLVLDVLE
jgi:transcriptional regulator of acetoin/glycerol metabolism